MIKIKIFAVCVLACMIAFTTSCTNTTVNNNETDNSSDTSIRHTLSAEDQELLAAFGDDINVISDEDYVSTINSFSSNPKTSIGKVFQIDGVLTYTQTHDEIVPYLYRTYQPNDSEKYDLGVTLRYLNVDVIDGDWVRVVGILANEDHDGHSHVVLDVVTIETPDQHGETILK